MLLKLTTFLLLAVVLVTAKRYDGHKVYQLVPKTDFQVEVLRKLMDGPGEQFDFWLPPSYVDKAVDVRVSPDSIVMFEGLLEVMNISFAVLVQDVQKMIEQVQAQDRADRLKMPKTDLVGIYARHDEINDWMEEICATKPTIASCGEVGTTTEGRSMMYIKIGNPTGADKPKIWIESTIHAREWLAGATAIYMIDRLLNKQDLDPDAKRMMDTYDWIFIPITNPDGYEYSHEIDRLWRKTRSRHEGASCFGVDANRNFGYMWGTGGASPSSCSEVYKGPSSFSEPETRAIADFVAANMSNTHAYFSLHTYCQIWLLPYGVKPDPPDQDELLRVGTIGVEALMAVWSKSWRVGSIVDVLYWASGGSMDWAHGALGLKYTYTLELRPQQFSYNGFVVPEREIKPSGMEVWAGLIAAIDAIPTESEPEI